MGSAAAFLLLGLVLLVVGGDALVRGASALSLRLGIPPLVIGLTVVAFGTSTPELVVSLLASSSGSGEIAFGNVVGSNLANIGLILGLTALITPLAVQSVIVLREIPMMLLAAAAVTVMATAGDLSGGDGTLERSEGVCLLLFFGVFLYALLADVVRGRAGDSLGEQVASTTSEKPRSLVLSAALILGGLLALVLGGHWLVESATQLALGLGVPEAVVGLSVVAVGTSLPELLTSVIAALRGNADMAIGNVIGSNIFNVLFILGTTVSLRPIEVPAGGFADTVAMLVLSALLLPLATTHARRLVRWEGAALLLAWAVYNGWRFLGTG